MSFVKVSKNLKSIMRRKGGYRENTIMDYAQCYTNIGKGNRYIKVHNRKKCGSSLDSALFDLKTSNWVN